MEYNSLTNKSEVGEKRIGITVGEQVQREAGKSAPRQAEILSLKSNLIRGELLVKK